jgi:hypothetical protein
MLQLLSLRAGGFIRTLSCDNFCLNNKYNKGGFLGANFFLIFHAGAQRRCRFACGRRAAITLWEDRRIATVCVAFNNKYINKQKDVQKKETAAEGGERVYQ